MHNRCLIITRSDNGIVYSSIILINRTRKSLSRIIFADLRKIDIKSIIRVLMFMQYSQRMAELVHYKPTGRVA